ncbi:MAG: hypothetical protein GY809_06790 [Planctomycetes bacterium]|nr:hypothetical protein [Planctomycetota bacterium]
MADRHHRLYGVMPAHLADAPFETPEGLLVCLSCHEVDACTGQILIERDCRVCHQPNDNEPVAVDDSYITEDNSVLHVPVLAGVLCNDRDADGDSLGVSLVRNVNSGKLKLLPTGDFMYRPRRNFVGNDSFTYIAHDGLFDSKVATVTLVVDADIEILVVDIMSDLNTNLTSECANAVLPAKILGSEDCNVTEIDGASLLLEEQLAPLQWTVEDDGHGTMDLMLKFDIKEVNNMLQDLRVGQMREVQITGTLLDGTPIMGKDFIVIVSSSRLDVGNMEVERSQDNAAK